MNVSNSSPSLPLARSVTAGSVRGLDVTVSDRGIDVRNIAAPTAPAQGAPTAAVQATPQVASTQSLQETLSTQEVKAIADRFADLPQLPADGIYSRAGRQAAPPLAAHQGSLIDITG